MSAVVHPFAEATLAVYNRHADRAETTAHRIFCEARGRFPNGTKAARADIAKLLTLLDQIDVTAKGLERIAEMEEEQEARSR